MQQGTQLQVAGEAAQQRHFKWPAAGVPSRTMSHEVQEQDISRSSIVAVLTEGIKEGSDGQHGRSMDLRDDMLHVTLSNQ
ncbi:hypothetical protein EJB05_58086 [Eragrostis curvula]|uniref:Uncharacterized protein n=1 Tax=Eragrostis curvula TaxID=38414 RepID=A0A5J9SBN9_9POAL|nr:hypothetical protein EJB05_58086 [Eragrostis curvula]